MNYDTISFVIVCTLLPLLALVAVCLRVYSQNLSGNRVHADDYIIISSVIVDIGFCAMTVYGVFHAGLAQPLEEWSGAQAPTHEKLIYASQLLWASLVTLIRIGLLMFYRRIFAIKKFRTANSVMMGVNMAWWIMTFFGTIIAYTVGAVYRMNFAAWLIVCSAFHMGLDIAVVCLPLFVIQTLQVSRKKKYALAGMFGLGLFCIIASLVRLVYFVQLSGYSPKDPRFFTVRIHCTLWATIEPSTSIVAVCLPTYGPLFKRCRKLPTLVRNVASNFSVTGSTSDGTTLSIIGDATDDRQKIFRSDMVSSSIETIKTPSTRSEYTKHTWVSSGGKYSNMG